MWARVTYLCCSAMADGHSPYDARIPRLLRANRPRWTALGLWSGATTCRPAAMALTAPLSNLNQAGKRLEMQRRSCGVTAASVVTSLPFSLSCCSLRCLFSPVDSSGSHPTARSTMSSTLTSCLCQRWSAMVRWRRARRVGGGRTVPVPCAMFGDKLN